jgi:hypothetical protein
VTQHYPWNAMIGLIERGFKWLVKVRCTALRQLHDCICKAMSREHDSSAVRLWYQCSRA